MSQTKETIEHESTVAEALIEVRTALGLSQAEAARNSGVPKRYIEFFEDCNTDSITLDVYACHKLRTYSNYLNLDGEKVVAAFKQEKACPQRQLETRHASRWRKHPLKNIPASRMIVTPKIIRTALIAAIALGIGVFFVIRAQNMTAPPMIVLTSPIDGFVTQEKTSIVAGQTEREVSLLVNGEAIYIDGEGNFSDKLDLREGLNIIRIVAIRKHGQKTELIRHIIVKSNERPTASLESYGPAK
ncbi:helix-turn-helix domain-containing protein [Patescibacteria group bacterium]|nr:helix-turn-helix domain-containing protein [Patescibacteria group bacterium]MBU1028715.1 helix-turn-helix domain-containing protein [Patescibacteria group bacterium]MBU1916300.1 helix-turn-helix domain-containing protein [Patescibacteria group bacterium]